MGVCVTPNEAEWQFTRRKLNHLRQGHRLIEVVIVNSDNIYLNGDFTRADLSRLVSLMGRVNEARDDAYEGQ